MILICFELLLFVLINDLCLVSAACDINLTHEKRHLVIFMHIENGTYNYAMSILKSNNGNPDSCHRYTFAYENPAAGEGHFIHTYKCDGNPLPSFEGEPKLIAIPNDMDEFVLNCFYLFLLTIFVS